MVRGTASAYSTTVPAPSWPIFWGFDHARGLILPSVQQRHAAADGVHLDRPVLGWGCRRAPPPRWTSGSSRAASARAVGLLRWRTAVQELCPYRRARIRAGSLVDQGRSTGGLRRDDRTDQECQQGASSGQQPPPPPAAEVMAAPRMAAEDISPLRIRTRVLALLLRRCQPEQQFDGACAAQAPRRGRGGKLLARAPGGAGELDHPERKNKEARQTGAADQLAAPTGPPPSGAGRHLENSGEQSV